MIRQTTILATLLVGLSSASVWAQSSAVAPTTTGPEVEACQASGLIALKERSPAIHDVVFEPDTLSITKADTSVGDIKVKTVVLGLADIQTGKKDKPHQFVCLIGEKGKVLLTFFTEK
ncbi:hypothetical protein P7D22_18645 [Lichenihabitans sp. Uapishka_5]|uniref:hypothetical protein n=1 Tax=Lichenihabitans sp. Uapishka_5 TaxID=3037302 RepID=UPI0029E7DE10|nr:hypothetical protein [Lichenihabitans sp. Uapishka_5]MDX7953186.1 hypothetical protein [Lichenihabitans sp. Uapishka_5]